MRVRDELKMTISSYQSLYQSADAFGVRKQLEAERNKNELQDKLEELRDQKNQLKKEKEELMEK